MPLPCPPGYYNPNTKQNQCLACPAGKYCASFKMTVGDDCLKGHFCEGTNDVYPGSATKIQIKSTPCPAGTYGAPA